MCVWNVDGIGFPVDWELSLEVVCFFDPFFSSLESPQSVLMMMTPDDEENQSHHPLLSKSPERVNSQSSPDLEVDVGGWSGVLFFCFSYLSRAT